MTTEKRLGTLKSGRSGLNFSLATLRLGKWLYCSEPHSFISEMGLKMPISAGLL